MRITQILVCALPLLVLGCKKESQSSAGQPLSVFPGDRRPSPSAPAISEWDKVKISSSGEIFVNKKQVTLAKFETECQRLRKAGGAAMVYTGDGDHVLSPAQGEAMHKLVDSGVPMKAATKESDLD